jgi:hypothetical protein
MNNKTNENPVNNNEYTLNQMNDLQLEQYTALIKAATSLKGIIPDIMDFPVTLPAFMLPA